MRAGLPSDKALLAQVDPADVAEALTAVHDARIVDLPVASIAELTERFAGFAATQRLAAAVPGSRSTYGELIQASGLPEAAQDKFKTAFLAQRGDGDVAQVWAAARDAGLGDADIRKLRLQGKLALLTGNSAGMTTRLLQLRAADGEGGQPIDDPVQLLDHDFDRAETWIVAARRLAGAEPEGDLTEAAAKALDALVPTAYAGATPQARLQAYAEDNARRLRLSYPTQLLGRKVERGEISLPAATDATVKVLRRAAAQGFRLGATSAKRFLEVHGNTREGEGEEEKAVLSEEEKAALPQLQALHRLAQITPGSEAVPVLMAMGLHSAYDVTELEAADFISRYDTKYAENHQGKQPAPDEAKSIFDRSVQVGSVVYNLFTVARKFDAELPVMGMSASPEVRDSVRSDLVKQFPTMESLFGSMDYCECEHCRSVLSPAAYLVDLLQSLEEWGLKRRNKWQGGAFAAPYDALIGKRPDIPYIALTCANTQTAMPYIDLVNEVLEYHIANDDLAGDAARDTGDAGTAELLAEPQYVIREAYAKLRDRQYPLCLPFDPWIETARQFCEHFETPMADVLDTLRPSDALSDDKQPFDLQCIFMERLGLSPAELSIFTDQEALKNWHALYGYDTPEEALTEAIDKDSGQRTDLNSAKALSRRLGVTYKELVEILGTRFVNPELAGLGLLCKLGVSIRDARFYLDHKKKPGYEQDKLLDGRNRSELSPADQLRFDELGVEDEKTHRTGWEDLREALAFEQRLKTKAEELAHAAAGLTTESRVQLAQKIEAELKQKIEAIAFDQVLMLVDPDSGCNFDLTFLRFADGTPADTGDSAQDTAQRIERLSPVLRRLNLLVRLWRKLGWTIEETGRALGAFMPPDVLQQADQAKFAASMETALLRLSHLKTLDERLKPGKQGRIKLLALWSDIAADGDKPLYAQLFLTPGVLKSDVAFDHPYGDYLTVPWLEDLKQSMVHEVQREDVKDADKIDPAAFLGTPLQVPYDSLRGIQRLSFPGLLSKPMKDALKARLPGHPLLAALLDAVQEKAEAFSLISSHMLALQGALGLTAGEIRQVIDGGKFDTAPYLSLASVSLLYRHKLLAKALSLSIAELLALKDLSGCDPFMLVHLHNDPLQTLEAQDQPLSETLRFIDIVDAVKASGLKTDDLEFLFRHRFDAVGRYRPDRPARLGLLKSLADGVRAIRLEHAVPPAGETPTDELLRQKLSLALAPEAVARLLDIVNGTAEFTVSKVLEDGEAPLDAKALESEPAVREPRYDDVRKLQKLTVRLFDPKRKGLEDRHAGALLATLFEMAQKQADEFFDQYLLEQAGLLGGDGGLGFLTAQEDKPELFRPLLGAGALGPDGNALDEETIGETNRKTLAKRRMRIAAAFLPFLQRGLVRQFIVQTLSVQTGSDPKLVESLLADKRMLGRAAPLLDELVAIGKSGVTVTFHPNEDFGGEALTVRAVADVDTALKQADAGGEPIKPGNADSAVFAGYLAVPATGAYRFLVELEKKGAKASLRFDHLARPVFLEGSATGEPQVLDEALELQAGVLYGFRLEIGKLAGGDVRLRVQGDSLPKSPVSNLTLYPADEADAADRAITLLVKVLQLAQSLDLGVREIRHVQTHAEVFGGLVLGGLPVQEPGPSEDAKAHFKGFLRLAAYVRLRSALSATGDELIDLFEIDEAAPPATRRDDVFARFATLTRREPTTVRAAARALFRTDSAFADEEKSFFKNEQPLSRLWQALQVVERFGVPLEALLDLSGLVRLQGGSDIGFEAARGLKAAVKARYEPQAWQAVAQPIFDRLRRRQRDALSAYFMHVHHLDRIEQVYEHLLIDPGMEPVVQTSRIRLAIASVQLFIQRCLLNLEPKVHPSAIDAKQWEWMKRYRVWEANRKIFLFPENWLEPEFRDDKTHLFSELEGALLQGDVSSDLVEDAFLNYLKKLDELARLDIVAMHFDDGQRVLHVFGRTFSQPYKYFYRRYARQMWTPWEPVSAEISGDHLAPVVWRDRLYLFWVTFLEKPEMPRAQQMKILPAALKIYPAHKSPSPPPSPPPTPPDAIANLTVADLKDKAIATSDNKLTVEAQLHWSEYLNGEWSTRESGAYGTPEVMEAAGLPKFQSDTVRVHVSKEQRGKDGEELGVYIHLGKPFEKAFYLAGRNSPPQKAQAYRVNGIMGKVPANPFLVSASQISNNRYTGTIRLEVRYRKQITTDPLAKPIDPKVDALLGDTGSYTLLLCNNNLNLPTVQASDPAVQGATDPAEVAAAINGGLEEMASLTKPFFYQNDRRRHTLFAEPSVIETTVENWKGWVPAPAPPGSPPLKVRPFTPFVPWLVPELDQVFHPPPIDQHSILGLSQRNDWLVNGVTSLNFDNRVIGPQGWTGLEFKSLAGLQDVQALQDTSLAVAPEAGAELGLARTWAASAEATQAAAAISVVGSAGFSAAHAARLTNLSGLQALPGLTASTRFNR